MIGGIVMDFKKMIIELLDKIDDSRILTYKKSASLFEKVDL